MRSPAAWLPTMGPWLPLLLCLRLYLGQRIIEQNEPPLPIPQVILDSGSVIPLGEPVVIRCRGPSVAVVFTLHKDNSNFSESQHPIWNEVIFTFPHMSEALVGHYYCMYNSLTTMSPRSETFSLAIAGVLPKPFLMASPSTGVPMGSIVTFRCWSDGLLDRLIVYQMEGVIPPFYRLAPDFDIELTFPKIRDKHKGIYSCIGFHSKDPLFWSLPSDPLKFTVYSSQDVPVGSSILVVLLLLGPPLC